MKILKAQAALLSNFEVYDLIISENSKYSDLSFDSLNHNQDQNLKPNPKQKQKQKHAQPANLVTVEHELLQYLEGIAGGGRGVDGEEEGSIDGRDEGEQGSGSEKLSRVKLQSKEKIGQFLSRMSKFQLTKAEKLQLLNIVPEKQVDLYLIIEEPEERFTEAEISDILSIVAETLL